MGKRDSWPLTLHCSNEYDRDLLSLAINTYKSILIFGEESTLIPPYLTKEETIDWAITSIKRSIASGVWVDQTEDFDIK